MPAPQPLSQTRVWTCVMINLCATPGLGSLMARRVVAGLGQLLLAVVGFLLITYWMCLLFYREINEAMQKPVALHAPDWLWQIGLLLFGAAWLWSLVTSISLLVDSKRSRTATLKNTPPRISEVPGGTKI